MAHIGVHKRMKEFGYWGKKNYLGSSVGAFGSEHIIYAQWQTSTEDMMRFFKETPLFKI